MNPIEIYTDGACKGNPGPGGWGVLLKHGTTEKELFGGEPSTTNNRMEMMAVIQALTALKKPCDITLYLDSQYVLKGITEWIPGWKAKGCHRFQAAGEERRSLAAARQSGAGERAPHRLALGARAQRRPGQ